MLRAPLSASTDPVCSTRPRSPHPYSPTTFDDQAHGLSAVAAPSTISVLAMTNPSPHTQPRAHTTEARSYDPRQPLRLRGKTASSCQSPRQYTIADTHALAALTCPAFPLSRSRRPSPMNHDPLFCPRKTTKTFPSPRSKSTSHTLQRRRFDLEPHAHHHQMLLAQLVSVREASLLLVPLGEGITARTMQTYSCTWQHHQHQSE